ncbi:hypothetical protein FACS1894172_07660 [Spirochaetia bacterium]|nr:hypothetical protein FACS1894172_07660 [Spirochaetia bacterium]
METFDHEIRGLNRRRELGCPVQEIEQVLHDLYILDGSDWLGRGAVGDLQMAATLAAYESFLAAWHSEKSTTRS